MDANWMTRLLARHACALAACSTDEARIDVLRAAVAESAARARLDALEPILGGALLMRDEALAEVAQAETRHTGQEACGAPPCGDAGHHGRALALHGRCVACEEAGRTGCGLAGCEQHKASPTGFELHIDPNYREDAV